MQSVATILLAGGQGKRMVSNVPKALHTLCGRTLLEYSLLAVNAPTAPIAVVGYGAAQIEAHFKERLRYCLQSAPGGTGGALVAARPLLSGEETRVLVLAADLPLIEAKTVEKLRASSAAAAVLSARVDNPSDYGRIVRGANGALQRVVEARDCTNEEQTIHEVRVSGYSFSVPALLPVLEALHSENPRGEISMADVLHAFYAQGLSIETIAVSAEEAMGVNDRVQLAACAKALRRRINEGHMRAGVTFVDPDTTYVDATVKIGVDCTLYPGVVLEGNTVIDEGTTLYPACRIVDSHIGRFCAAQGVVARSAVVGDYVTMGPYVNLRPGANIRNNCKIGNYIEVKNSTVDEGSKLPHLSYIGDGDVGKRVNVGCGSVFVNYDGKQKHRTQIGDDVFIGCNTSLVAPVRVGARAYTAAGSVITEDVPEDTLAIGRARQVNKLGYVEKLQRKQEHFKKES